MLTLGSVSSRFLRLSPLLSLFAQVFSKRSFTKNYLVQNLVAKLDDLDCLGSCPAQTKPVKVDGKCDQHGEELKLYCQTDKRPICVVCRESRAHRLVGFLRFFNARMENVPTFGSIVKNQNRL